MPPKGWRKGDGLARDNAQDVATQPQTPFLGDLTAPPAPAANQPQKTHGEPPAAVYGPVSALASVKCQDAVVVGGRILKSVLCDASTTLEATPHGVLIRRAASPAVLVPWANVVSAVVA